MMSTQNYDSTFQGRIGELVTLTAQLLAPPGVTYQIQSGTFVLSDSLGNTVVGPSSLSGFQPGPLNNPKAYYLLNTASLPAGVYAGEFLIVANWSNDGEQQSLAYTIQITLEPAYVGAPATYDGGATPLGQVRMLAGDCDLSNNLWSDPELENFLCMAGGVPSLAASFALEATASDNVRLAVIIKVGEYSKDATQLAAELRSQAQELRRISITMPVVRSPLQAFRPDYGQYDCGNMIDW